MGQVRASNPVRTLAAVLALLCVAGCASEFDRRYKEAEGLRAQAAVRGYEWLGTAALLEQAREQAEEGNTDAALELVEAARFQSEAALLQADHEVEAWRNRVLK